METNTNISAFPTKRFSSFCIGTAFGLLVAATVSLVSTVSAGPSNTDVAIGSLQSSYNQADSILGHCRAIIEAGERIKKDTHEAAQGLKE